MNAELALTVDRVERSRAARDAREAGRTPTTVKGAGGRTRALDIGARVFDLVTGQEGEVVYGTRENFIVPTTERRDG
jgi:hypothetical protein